MNPQPGPSIPWIGYNPKPRRSGNNPYKDKNWSIKSDKFKAHYEDMPRNLDWYNYVRNTNKTLPERDLQSQRHYYYYNGKYISVITLQNYLIISSDPIIINFYLENDVLTINRNNIIHKNDSIRNLESFITCLGLSLLYYKNKINMNTVVNYGDKKFFVHYFSKLCIPFNTKRMIIERESDINRLKSFKFKLKKIMSKKKSVIHLEPLKIDVSDKKKSSEDIIRSNKLQNDSLTTYYILVPKINNAQILYNNFISSSINYINNLSLLDQMTISGYTRSGDEIVNDYIRGEFNMDTINHHIYEYERYYPDLTIQFPFFQQIIEMYYPNEPITLDLYVYVVDHLGFKVTLFDWEIIIQRYIQDLKRILNNAPKLEFNMMLFRGLDSDYVYTYKEKTGNIYLDNREFKSASIDYTVANKFSYPKQPLGDETSCCVLRIFVPKGTRVLYINGVSNAPGEHEVLLNIGTKFLVKENSIFNSNIEPLYRNMKTTDVVIVN